MFLPRVCSHRCAVMLTMMMYGYDRWGRWCEQSKVHEYEADHVYGEREDLQTAERTHETL